MVNVQTLDNAMPQHKHIHSVRFQPLHSEYCFGSEKQIYGKKKYSYRLFKYFNLKINPSKRFRFLIELHQQRVYSALNLQEDFNLNEFVIEFVFAQIDAVHWKTRQQQSKKKFNSIVLDLKIDSLTTTCENANINQFIDAKIIQLAAKYENFGNNSCEKNKKQFSF